LSGFRPLPLAVQLYSFRDPSRFGGSGLGLDLSTLRAIADAGFSGVETVDVPGDDPVAARRVLADLGLAVTSAHTWAEHRDVAAIARAAANLAELGAHRMIVSGRGFETVAATDAFADGLLAAAEVAAEHGLRLGYHNHDAELGVLDGVRVIDRLATRLGDDVDLQVDIFWVVVGGADPATVIGGLGRRVVSLHVKDGVDLPSRAYDAEPFVNVPVGSGVVDPGPAIDAAMAAGSVEWLIVEFDHVSGSAIEAAQASAAYLIGRGLARGRGG
jgi:sugar phosphate isomerase/epimerase